MPSTLYRTRHQYAALWLCPRLLILAAHHTATALSAPTAAAITKETKVGIWLASKLLRNIKFTVINLECISHENRTYWQLQLHIQCSSDTYSARLTHTIKFHSNISVQRHLLLCSREWLNVVGSSSFSYHFRCSSNVWMKTCFTVTFTE